MTTLIPEENRLRFSLYFVAATVLASALSGYPTSALLDLLSSAYPSNPVQPSLPSPTGLLDMLSGIYEPNPNQGWINYFGLLNSMIVHIVVGAFTGVFQWIVLRQYLSKGNWVLATILGYQIGGLIASNPLSPAIYYAFVCRGFFQWLMLRQIVRDSWTWLLTHPLALPLAVSFHALLSGLGSSWLPYSITLAILQAIVLCSLKQKPQPAVQE